MDKIIQINRDKSFVFTHSGGTQYDFNQYRDTNQFGQDIHSGRLLIKDAEYDQYEIRILINTLKS